MSNEIHTTRSRFAEFNKEDEQWAMMVDGLKPVVQMAIKQHTVLLTLLDLLTTDLLNENYGYR